MIVYKDGKRVQKYQNHMITEGTSPDNKIPKMLRKRNFLVQGDVIFTNRNNREKRKIIKEFYSEGVSSRWPKGLVPFEISSEISTVI